MSEHTPGPWRLQKMRQEGMFSIGMGTFYATGLIGEANARLIAQAWTIPALREALEGMLMEWDKFTRYGSPMAKAANERIAAARAALKLGQDNG